MGLGDGKDIILLSKAIRMILRGLVSADSKPRNWVICDNPHSSIAGKNLLAAVLFQELKASTVSFVPTPFLALFASGATASLVVDVGYKSTTVVPVIINLIIDFR